MVENVHDAEADAESRQKESGRQNNCYLRRYCVLKESVSYRFDVKVASKEANQIEEES
jgi:hypothetical protein